MSVDGIEWILLISELPELKFDNVVRFVEIMYGKTAIEVEDSLILAGKKRSRYVWFGRMLEKVVPS